MAMRLSGLMSGMDTESIVQELVYVKQSKVDKLVKEQTKLEWKMEAWKELNNKVKKFYNGTLSNLRFQSSYAKKTTKVSNSSVCDIITAGDAMDSVQTLRVKNLAQSGYLTGAEVKKTDGEKCTGATKLTDMGVVAGSKLEVTAGGKTTAIEVTADMTLSGLTSELKKAGVNANFDSKTQRLFIGATESGATADFTITAANDAGTTALEKLGILVYDNDTFAKYQKYVDMQSDTDAYNAALNAEVANKLASYIAKADELSKNISSLEEKMTSAKDAYYEKYVDADDAATDDFDALVNSDVEDETSPLAQMKARIEELKDIEEPSDEEKAELEKLQGKVSAVEKYQEMQKGLKTAQTALADAQTYFDADDKTATQKLNDEVKAQLDAKIAKAADVIANKATLKGSVGATKVDGIDAEIYLNNALFTGSSNTFEINGLTITCNAETGNDTVTLTTQNDTSGVYDMIKDFITGYSELINEMDKLYNAEDADDYEPLTDDEKYEMSENEIEKWETKIKDSLLRKDSTLNTVSSAFREIMSSGFTVDGKKMYLSDFGIETLGYFDAPDNERNAYHIDGDEDDEYVSTETNTLKAKIGSDPNAVTDFFSQLAKKLYEKTTSLMGAVQGYSSSYTLYEDKKMESDYKDYASEIAEMEEKLLDYENKWYSKFAAMETAMAKMQSNANAVTSLIGG
ncbi:MAG: flagellar filament capping protein FliD [Lachnospiraceae bacterium]|nr:flagellar filament capping protein FliD [Lachnospiraceae bacterium]